MLEIESKSGNRVYKVKTFGTLQHAILFRKMLIASITIIGL